MQNTKRRLSALLLILLFATEGHMSSGIRGMELPELIQRSDAILVVKKDKPYVQNEEWPFPNRDEPPFRYLEGKPMAMTIHPSYQPMTNAADSADQFIIFIQHDEAKGRFSFTASGAMEREEVLEKIRAVRRESMPRPPR